MYDRSWCCGRICGPSLNSRSGINPSFPFTANNSFCRRWKIFAEYFQIQSPGAWISLLNEIQTTFLWKMWTASTYSIGLTISVMRNCVMPHNYFVLQLPARINHKFCFPCPFQQDNKIVLGGKVNKTFHLLNPATKQDFFVNSKTHNFWDTILTKSILTIINPIFASDGGHFLNYLFINWFLQQFVDFVCFPPFL